jgi:hypothetical protein
LDSHNVENDIRFIFKDQLHVTYKFFFINQ